MSRPDRLGNGQNPYALPHRFVTARDRRIDFLRGLAVLAISANHIWAESANLSNGYKFGHFFAFDFADVFLMLSGIVAGMVFFPLLQQNGMRACYKKSLRRAGHIWGVHILCVLAALPVILIFERGLGVTGSSLSPFEHSLFSGFAGNFLLYHPSVFLDILPIYIGLFVMLPLALIVFRYSAPLYMILTLSIWAMIWIPVNLAAVGIITLPALLLKSAYFIHPFAAQLVFFAGVVIGIYKSAIEAFIFTHGSGVLITCVFFIIVSDYLSQVVGTGHEFIHEYYLHPLRLTDLLAVMAIIWSLTKPHLSPEGNPNHIENCGRHILPVFAITTVGAVFFTYLNHWLDAGALIYGLCIAGNVALCLLSGHLLEQRRVSNAAGKSKQPIRHHQPHPVLELEAAWTPHPRA